MKGEREEGKVQDPSKLLIPAPTASCYNMFSEKKRKLSSESDGQREGLTCVLEILPKEILLNILVHVASNSLVDICNVKQSCKELRNLGSDDLVFRHVTLNSIRISLYQSRPPELVFFLARCEESGNPESLYMHGMIEYFKESRPLLGCRLLKKAANLGHAEATYVLGIVLLCMDDESIRHGMSLLDKPDTESSIGDDPTLQGLSLLKNLEAEIGRFELGRVRQKCEGTLGAMWPTKPVHRRQPICMDPKCILIREITFSHGRYTFYCKQCISDLLQASPSLRKVLLREKAPCLNPRCGVESTKTNHIICRTCKWDNELIRFQGMQRH